MSNEKEVFDLVGLTLGMQRFVMPKRAAFALFEAMQGCEIYKVESWFKDNKYDNKKERAFPVDSDQFPTLTALNPVYFHTYLNNQKEYEEYMAQQK